FRDEFYVVAGYVGSVDMWKRVFSPAWKSLIQQGPTRISEFKASKCRSKKGEFVTWTQDECTELVKSLVTFISGNEVMGVATGVVFPGIADPQYSGATRGRRALEQLGHELCATSIVLDMLRGFPRFDEVDSVQIVFDRKLGYWKRISRRFEMVRSQLGSGA